MQAARARFSPLQSYLSIPFLLLGVYWVVLNTFYLPFLIWTEGLHRPWLILQGLIPYRDFEWIRTPFDLYLLAGIYKIFGFNPLYYQLTLFALYLGTGILIFFFFVRKAKAFAIVSYLLYVFLAFFLYSTTQIGEVLVGVFVFLTFVFLWLYDEKRSNYFLLLSGVFCGFALITKQTSTIFAAFSFLSLFVFGTRGLFRRMIYFLLGVCIPVLPLLFYYYFNNALLDFFYYIVVFNVSVYREQAPLWGLRDALPYLILHIASVLLFLLVKTPLFSLRAKLIIAVMVVGLLPTLLPTYWSYRLVTALPILTLMLAALVTNAKGLLHTKVKVLVMVLAFIIPLTLSQFASNYQHYIKSVSGFSFRHYTIEYAPYQKKVVDWLIKNTTPNERIFNTDSNIVMFYSRRLPHNKYVDALPWVYFPLDVSFRDITRNPPRVVVYDSTLPTSWPVLKKWKFIPYLYSHYKRVEKYDAIEIYVRR